VSPDQLFKQADSMKKSLIYEISAAAAATLGAILLAAVYLPVLNPGMLWFEGQRYTLSYYIIATPIPIFILVASWYFNRKSQQLKKTGK
jgi:hypothetical protein